MFDIFVNLHKSAKFNPMDTIMVQRNLLRSASGHYSGHGRNLHVCIYIEVDNSLS